VRLPEGPVLFRLEYPAVTPHIWSVQVDREDRMRFVARRNLPADGQAGAGGGVEFEFMRLGDGPARLTFTLATPWSDEPVEVRNVFVE
jgi:hypothetical protein